MKMRVTPLLLAIAAMLLSHRTSSAQELETSFTGFEQTSTGEVLNAEQPSVFDSELARRNEELERRIAQLEARLNSSQPAVTLDQAQVFRETGTGGLFGSTEVTFLKPSMSSALSVGLGFGGEVYDAPYHADVRYVLGYRTDSGVGVRGRFWRHDDHIPFSPTFAIGALSLDAEAIDLEATVQQIFRRFELGLSAGVRYAKLQYGTIGVTPLFTPGTLRYEGLGPTFSLEGRRHIGQSGFAIFANGRGSVLVGDINQALVIPSGTAAQLDNEIMTIFENQLGVSWTKPLGSTILDVRTGWETQYWASNTMSDDFLGIGSNLLLTGPTIAIELRY